MRRPAVTSWRKGRISSGFSGPPNAIRSTESAALIAFLGGGLRPPSDSSPRGVARAKPALERRPGALIWPLRAEGAASSARELVKHLHHRSEERRGGKEG